MKKALKKLGGKTWHVKDGVQIEGPHSGVRGDLSDVRGDLSGVWGDLSGVRGDLSGVWGDLSDVSGDLDDCEISDAERAMGVDIADLIGE